MNGKKNPRINDIIPAVLCVLSCKGTILNTISKFSKTTQIIILQEKNLKSQKKK